MIKRDMELTDGDIVLRPPNHGDEEAVFKAVRSSITDLSPWLVWCSPEYCLADTRSWINQLPGLWQQGTDHSFAVFQQHDGRLIGGCGLSQVDLNFRMANLGYWVRSDQRGRKIAARAACLAAQFGFARLELVRLEMIISIRNIPSLWAAEKTGAHREGVLRNRLVIHEKVQDAVMHSLTPADFNLGLRGFSKV